MLCARSRSHDNFLLCSWLGGPKAKCQCVSRASPLTVRSVCSGGVPQGAPESPLVFFMTSSDCALGRLQEQLARTDADWSIDTPSGPLLIHCLAYADNVLVFPRSESALARMLCEHCVEFGNIGLEVALDKKTFWSSSVNSSGHFLLVNGVSLPWAPSLEIIGSVFDFGGHSGKSAEHRQLKANGVFRRWAPLLTNQSLPIRERMKAFRVSVATSALWLAGCCGNSRKLRLASSARGLLSGCVEWSLAGECLTKPLSSIGAAVTERDTLSPSLSDSISRSNVCCRDIA